MRDSLGDGAARILARRMSEWAKRTWVEARDAVDARAIALVPIGCTEPHGPHLPLDTDVTIALAQSRRAVELFAQVGLSASVLPAIAYGVTNYTEGFAGRITLRPGTLWALIEDVIEALEQEGIRRIVLVNGHLEPAHVAVLRGVVLDHAVCSASKAQAIVADNTRRRFASRLGEEFAGGDCHAGRYETSIVLHADPTAVRATRERLPAVKVDLLAQMAKGVRSFRDAGASAAYCGDPASASAAEGRERVDELARIVVDAAREAWPDLFA